MVKTRASGSANNASTKPKVEQDKVAKDVVPNSKAKIPTSPKPKPKTVGQKSKLSASGKSILEKKARPSCHTSMPNDPIRNRTAEQVKT